MFIIAAEACLCLFSEHAEGLIQNAAGVLNVEVRWQFAPSARGFLLASTQKIVIFWLIT
jgi:hypothetical protein